MAGSPDTALLAPVLGRYPRLVCAGVALLTVLVQTSTASIGFGIGLAQGRALALDTLIPWVLGANIGTALTMSMAGTGSIEGRRLGLRNILERAAAALIILIALPAVSALLQRALPGAADQQVANFNTLFNLAIGLLVLPLLGPFSRLLVSWLTLHQRDLAAGELSPLLLQTSSLALNQATREEMRMIDEIHVMLRSA